MEKKTNIKRLIIILIIIHILPYLLFSSIFLFSAQQKSITNNNIYNSLSKYEKSGSVVYYGRYVIYYRDETAKFDSDVEYVNDDTILWSDTDGEKNAWVDYKNERFVVDVDLSNHYNYFVSECYIYSMKSIDSYYKYNYRTKEQELITKEEYNNAKSGNKYNIDFSKDKINISSNYLDNDILISRQDIIDFLDEKEIAGSKKFYNINYQISDDILYIQLYYHSFYEIILSYDIETGKTEIVDWFKHYYDVNDESSVDFYVFKNKYPVSLERYFMVKAYE